ncbi:hypothetical protein AGR5A_pa40109 [Agrobacterium genomosp. 5 str. CFBP 6626]|nr:hypothetical protein AGR5A_pa40109 [Agrobacterium genomosp. 5 str. CFBP 6626]
MKGSHLAGCSASCCTAPAVRVVREVRRHMTLLCNERQITLWTDTVAIAARSSLGDMQDLTA